VIVDRDGKQEAYIKAQNAGSGQQFGYGLLIDGDTLVASAPYDDSGAVGVNGNVYDLSAPDSGAVYVFVRRNGAWNQQAYLKPSDTAPEWFFGSAIAISGDTIAVGAIQDDFMSFPTHIGAVYVFVRNAGTWTQQQRLVSSDGEPRDLFGYALALQGDTLAIGANLEGNLNTRTGAVYMFQRNGTVWSEKQKLKAAEPHTSSQFGNVLSLWDDTLVISAGEDNTPARRSGEVYVFQRTGERWTERQQLLPSPISELALFGYSTALRGDRLLVGAPRLDLMSFPDAPHGDVYVYDRVDGEFRLSTKLAAPVATRSDYFGSGVALTDDTILVGACGDASNARGLGHDSRVGDAPRSGAAYLYARKEDDWEQSAYLKASNAESQDGFGCAVTLSDELAIVSAIYEDSAKGGINPAPEDNQSENSGAVYVFH
jgi:hypothetical protein